jgi:heterodisulfide reductase subunit B
MEISYYPGCALHGSAREYDESTRAVAKLLGAELRELPDWNCCGASSAHASSEALAFDLANRNLSIARQQGMDLVVPCAACFSRLRAALSEADSLKEGQKGNLRVLSLPDFFLSAGLLDALASCEKRSLQGLKAVCYYGCLLVRPPKVTGAAHHEFPQGMDRLMELIGVETLPWSHKTDCCGGSLALTRTDIVLALTGRLLEEARRAGAEAVIVACPLCQSNLDSRQHDIASGGGTRYDMPIFYFTELIGISLNHKDASRWLKRHLVDPTKVLASKGLSLR